MESLLNHTNAVDDSVSSYIESNPQWVFVGLVLFFIFVEAHYYKSKLLQSRIVRPVRGNSMSPLINHGDVIIIEYALDKKSLAVGDNVVFECRNQQCVVKRIVGVEVRLCDYHYFPQLFNDSNETIT